MTDTATAEAALNAAVAKYAREGYTVTDRSPGQVILQRKKKIGILKPLILIVLALTIIGLFFIPLVLGILNRKTETVVLTVDARGKVRAQK